MSQDDEKCTKCGKPCGYDDEKGYSEGFNLAYCGECRGNLANRFCAFFGLGGASFTHYALEIDWDDVDKILSCIKRDYARRISYLITDKELYQHTQTLPVSVLES